MMTDHDHISVCICTYQRPELLENLLRHLARQETRDLFTYSVVVADNDVQESGRSVVERVAADMPCSITYCVEARQNIARARNLVILHATGNWLAFIDDDEFPGPEWLVTLFECCRKYEVNGVLAPVLPHFEKEPPAWIVKGGFYDRPRHETGFVIDWNEGRTGNVLLKRSILSDQEEPFRPEFGSGGEDRDFFKRMIGRGYRFVWCDEASVYETVPQVRWSRSFMLRRALLRGKVSLTAPASRPLALLKSFVAIPAYALALPFLLAWGHHAFMKCLIRICDHLGRLLAFFGVEPVKQKYVVE